MHRSCLKSRHLPAHPSACCREKTAPHAGETARHANVPRDQVSAPIGDVRTERDARCRGELGCLVHSNRIEFDARRAEQVSFDRTAPSDLHVGAVEENLDATSGSLTGNVVPPRPEGIADIRLLVLPPTRERPAQPGQSSRTASSVEASSLPWEMFESSQTLIGTARNDDRVANQPEFCKDLNL